MERVSGGESSGETSHGQKERRGFDALEYEMAMQEMQRSMKAMEVELCGYKERLLRIREPPPHLEEGEPRAPRENEELRPQYRYAEEIPRFKGEVRRELREQLRKREENLMPRVYHGGRGNGHLNALNVKVDVPEFDGKGGVDSFLEWTHTISRVFELKELDGHEVVKLVALKLRGYVSI